VPITGIAISPNKALFISTQGRGIWWRRDVISGLPNSGINTPARGSSTAGTFVAIRTDCSYRTGWHHIKRLEFKLSLAHGPGDGAPSAAWLRLNVALNRVGLYDPDTHRWRVGAVGSNRTLATRYATLRLDRTSVTGVAGAHVPTVEIHWDLKLTTAAEGNLQQYLRVTDDRGRSTSWDRVGSWRVKAPA
jgi:hypothetical protein